MVCNEVRERLSEYLDDVLPIQTKARVDQHLSACPVCREELALLRSLVRRLEGLEPVSAPNGFLDQIHGRLDQTTWLKRMFRVLFFPLKLKVPMQVAGAVVAALLIFSLLTVEQTKERFISPSSDPKQAPSPSAAPSPGLKEKDVPALVGSRPETAVEAQRQTRQPGAATPSPSADEASIKNGKTIEGRKETEKLTDEVGAGGKAAGRIERVEVVLRVPSARFHGLPDLQPDMKTDAGDRRVASDLAGGAKTEDKSYVKKGNGPLLQELRALVEGYRGRILEAGYQAESGKLDRLRIEIPTSQSTAFFTDLKALGEIPSTPAVTHIADTVQVFIYVLEAN